MIVGHDHRAFVTFGIGGWAATSQLSGAVIGQGVVVVDSSVKKVQHATGGHCRRAARAGRRQVNAGDILIRLDETQTLANATIVTQSLDELLARQARLEAERDSADEIVFPKALMERSRDSHSEAARAIAAERALFDLRREARAGQKSQLKERARAAVGRDQGLHGTGRGQAEGSQLIHRELEGVRRPVAKESRADRAVDGAGARQRPS